MLEIFEQILTLIQRSGRFVSFDVVQKIYLLLGELLQKYCRVCFRVISKQLSRRVHFFLPIPSNVLLASPLSA